MSIRRRPRVEYLNFFYLQRAREIFQISFISGVKFIKCSKFLSEAGSRAKEWVLLSNSICSLSLYCCFNTLTKITKKFMIFWERECNYSFMASLILFVLNPLFLSWFHSIPWWIIFHFWLYFLLLKEGRRTWILHLSVLPGILWINFVTTH